MAVGKLRLHFVVFFFADMCSNVASTCRLQYQCSGTCICCVVGIFVQRHMLKMLSVCILVFLVTFLFYQIYICSTAVISAELK